MIAAPLSTDAYPGLDPADVGLYPNVGYGSVEGVPCHCIVGGATSQLASDVTSAQGTLTVADASRFPSAPFTVQVASERMTVTNVTGNVLTVTRGQGGTEASAHAQGRTVFEVRTEYVYLVSPEPLKAIRYIYVDGVLQDTGYTAYTGQAGDEHPDWPGQAVVAFTAEASVRRQHGGTVATEDVEAEAVSMSHEGLTGVRAVPIGGKRDALAWVAFTGTGEITAQRHTAQVKNTGASEAAVSASVVDFTTASVLKAVRPVVPAGETVTLTVDIEGGDWDTLFVLAGGPGTFEVSGMRKAATAIQPVEDEDYIAYAPPVEVSTFAGTALMSPDGKVLHRASYPSTELGQMVSQLHTVQVENTGATSCVFKLLAVEPGGAVVAEAYDEVPVGATGTLTLGHKGGEWDTMTVLSLVSGAARLRRLSKEVVYIAPGTSVSDTPYTSTARAVVGDVISVDADWAVDLTGEYGGVGSLIERPDRVIRHMLQERMGFTESELDLASIEAAGNSYASAIAGGYKFGFVINMEVVPSDFVRTLAYQSRSAVFFTPDGRWRLIYLPDAAPSPVRVVSYEDLAGEGAMFSFSRTPASLIGNDLTGWTVPDYSGAGYLAAAFAEDAASQALYGVHKREIEFPALRDKATAEDVLAHVLLELKAPLLTVTFPVFWEHDLQPGDTIEIDNPLYDGRRWFVEKVEGKDKFRSEVEAREWRG